MRELRGSAANLSLCEGNDGPPVGMVEVIIVLSEPTYSLDDGGDLVRRRVVTQERFGVSAKALRQLAAQYINFADQADALAARAHIDPEPDAPA